MPPWFPEILAGFDQMSGATLFDLLRQSPSHAAEFFALLGGGQRDAGWDGPLPTPSRLAIAPGSTHYNILDAPLLPSTIAAFCR
jgi:hypothetical protein